MSKRILVTGGVRGIGRAIVEELAARDYQVIATYYTSKEAADAITKQYPSVTFLQVDLEDRKALGEFMSKVAKERIDVLINNAGVWLGKPFDKTTERELLQQIDLNFAAPAQIIRGLLPTLKKSAAPTIVNISSQAAHPVYPGEAMYSASKAALSTLSEILRAELNPQGIRVITVEPWGVNTYGMPEPSGMVNPAELAQTIRYVIEAPEHIQLEKIGISHIKQWRGNYPEWIET